MCEKGRCGYALPEYNSIVVPSLENNHPHTSVFCQAAAMSCGTNQ